MKYLSTRGKVKGLSFEDTLLSGYASDGGMLLPQEIPIVDHEKMKSWSKLSYQDLVKDIMSMFISDAEIPKTDLDNLVTKAFSRFTEANIVKVSKLKSGLNILELFHGPTMAFKDLALSCVGQLLEYFLEKRKKHITVLVGTSGDTGSAAIESVRGLRWVDIIVLLPKGRCSRVQELQMTTVIEDNVHVYRVDGTSDDLDEPIRKCFVDSNLVTKHSLCSINSINWVRILVQIAHYFYSYFQLSPDCEGEVEVVIPTGACGNVTGGLIARQMGLPIQLVCAVNSNNIVDRAFSRGDFSITDDVIETLAPAMNIQVPYNIERILYLVNGHDTDAVCQFMEKFDKAGKSDIPKEVIEKIRIRSCTVDDGGIQRAMNRCWEENKYLLCPHSAVAAKYHYDSVDQCGLPNVPRMCVATASPAKFEEAVQSAGLTPSPTEAIKSLDNMQTKYIDLEKSQDWEQILRDKLEDIYKERIHYND